MQLPTSTRPKRRALGTTLVASLMLGGLALVQAATSTPAGATVPTEVTSPGTVWVKDAVSVPGDAIYLARGATIDRFVPGSPVQTITLPGGSDASLLAVAPDGTVWFAGLSGSLGTVSPSGTVTTRALADQTAGVSQLTVATDGAVWVMMPGDGRPILERGAPGGAMTDVPVPDDTHPYFLGAGYDGSVIAVGLTDSIVAADGTFTPIVGLDTGFEREVKTIGGHPWVIGLDWAAEFGPGNVPTNSSFDLPASTYVSSAGAGPDGGGWFVGYGGGDNDDALLGRFDSTGRTGLAVATDTPPGGSELVGSQVVADPSADRLWVVGHRGAEVRLAPIELDRTQSAMTLTTPASFTIGASATISAQVTPWDAGPAPTGTVTFSNGATTVATVPVAADGSATAMFTPPTRSAHLRATYSGDAVHAPSRTFGRWVDVAAAATTITFTAPPKPWRPGPVTLEVSVTAPGTVQPTGTVDIGNLHLPVSGGLPTSFATTFSLGQNPTFYAGFQPVDGFKESHSSFTAGTVGWATDEENYVGAAYLRLFGRNADTGGRTYWANKIRNGLSRDRFALTQVTTSEYRRTVAKRVGLISGSATPAQAKPTVDAMAKSTVRNLLVEKWAAAKAVTDCRDTINPTFAAPGSFMCWVKVIVTTYKGSASASDYTWANGYGNTLAGRRKIAKILVYSDTAVRPLVETDYRNYLDRAPDPSGWTYWTKKIQSGTREEAVEAMILGSNEFYRRTLIPAG